MAKTECKGGHGDPPLRCPQGIAASAQPKCEKKMVMGHHPWGGAHDENRYRAKLHLRCIKYTAVNGAPANRMFDL